jgi:hypothetical protein
MKVNSWFAIHESNSVAENPDAKAKPPPISKRTPHGIFTAACQSSSLRSLLLLLLLLVFLPLLLSLLSADGSNGSIESSLSIISVGLFSLADEGIRNSIKQETRTIVESSIDGKISFQSNPLVIHAIAVAANIVATIFSSLVILPSFHNLFIINSFP